MRPTRDSYLNSLNSSEMVPWYTTIGSLNGVTTVL